MLPDTFFVEGYDDAINRVCRQCKKEGISTAVLSGCLRIVALTANKACEHTVGSIRHIFYHLTDPEEECQLSTAGGAVTELTKIAKSLSFADLVWHNMRSGWGTPIFLWGIDRDHQFDLAIGRIVLLVQFDLEAFFKLCEQRDIKMSWVTGKESEELREMSYLLPGLSECSRGACRATRWHGTNANVGLFRASDI